MRERRERWKGSKEIGVINGLTAVWGESDVLLMG